MSTQPIRLALVLHNHQPIGNFEHVFEQAYRDSYLPFLDVFEQFPSIRISLHTSGSLMQWLSTAHPEYIGRLGHYVAQQRIEILGGPFYEPILTMIPARDRVGQIRSYTRWLESRLGATVRGMWIPERVWEQSFVRDLAAAGIDYTLVDDFHFKNAGLVESQLYGGYLTEDEGRTITVFPGSERLRYLIPFADPEQTVHYLAAIRAEHPGATIVFGDDGEKFGTWPDTKKHVYEDRWLARFFEALVAAQDWLDVTTLSEAVKQSPPLGKIYLPDSSYREMTEWALPTTQQGEYDRMVHSLERDERWPLARRFVRGGFWRNFKVKYPESDEMYARMMGVSRRLARALDDGFRGELIEEARGELYRGQCNCSYWHGAFGGIYLPHLRNAVYRHLIAADKLLDKATRPTPAWVEAKSEDFNFDGRPEVQLSNNRLTALFAPARGGTMYELDVHAICHNLLATLARREEVYHAKIRAGAAAGADHCASIHDRVIFKQEGLDRRLQYDRHLRKSLLDHFYDADASLEAVADGAAAPRGDFTDAPYEARVRRNPDRHQVLLIREGTALGAPIRLTKGVTLAADATELEIAYLLEGLPAGQTFHFAVEFNFAGMPAGADDRYFHNLEGHRHGQLGARLNLTDATAIGLVDDWLGIDVGLRLSRPSGIWTFPIESVSGSEGGFELVHQSVVVQPHWHVTADAHGAWNVTMTLALDTSRAEDRVQQARQAMAGV